MKVSIVKNIIVRILSLFEENDLDYVVLRNYENSFTDLNKDLDLLISSKHEKKIVSIIVKECAKYCTIIHTKKDHKRTVIFILFNNDNLTQDHDSLFMFDLNKYITLKNKSNKKGFGKKIKINDVQKAKYQLQTDKLKFSILSPRAEAILLLNHYIGKKKSAYYKKINMFLLANGVNKLPNSNCNIEIRNTLNYLLIKQKDVVPINQLFRNFMILVGYIKNRLFEFQNSRVIYFSGPDGSGKSTSYIFMMSVLDKMKIKYFPLRSLQIGMQYFYSLKNHSKKKNTGKTFTNVGRLGYSDLKRDRNTGKLAWKARRFIGLFIGLLDIIIFGRIFLFIKKVMGHVIMVEESPLDIYVKRHRPKFPVLEKMFLPFLPKPTNSILCNASIDSIYQRKPELKKEELKDYYFRIESLYTLRKKLNKIDLSTDISIKESNHQIKLIINNLLSKE